MPVKHLYEYAVIRILPIAEREEFLNVGVILFCKKEKYIRIHYQIDEVKLRLFSVDIDIEQLRLNLQSFEKIALGTDNCGQIAQMDIPSRYRWLTAVRSSIIQTSKTHPGLSNNLEQTAKRLFEELVL